MTDQASEFAQDFRDSGALALQHITLKSSDAFLVADTSGDLLRVNKEMGLFWHGTRFLQLCHITLQGYMPVLLSYAVAEGGDTCRIDLTNESMTTANGIAIGQGEIHVARQLTLRHDRLIHTLTVTSFYGQPLDINLTLYLGSDFSDLFEVRGIARQQHGQLLPIEQHSHELVLGYHGLDDVTRETHVTFSPAVVPEKPGIVAWKLHLEHAAPLELRAEIQMSDTDTRRRMSMLATGASARHQLTPPTINTSDPQGNRLLKRGMSDMLMLSTQTPEGYFPYAGIPWYCCPFGRDGLISAMQFLPWLPEVMRGTLTFLARFQGTKNDDFTDEEPGKIMHELRSGEMANLRELPFIPYYGTIDATALFLIALEGYIRWTNDSAFAQQLWSHAQAAARWIIDSGDRDGDGFLEYGTRSDKGLMNQGWKDSNDSISQRDGSLAKAPIALCEVQGYAYAAFNAMSYLATRLNQHDEVQFWHERAQQLQANFLRHFWWEEENTCYLALDGDKRPCAVVTSNAGHCLWSGIIPEDKAQRLSGRLMRADMFSGWGIRTLSTQAARYNPMSYHNGSVWPHDTALVGAGMARYGGKVEASQLLRALVEASLYYEDARLPELYCGFPKHLDYGPTRYPVACSPQAWATGASYMLISALLGFKPDAEQQCLILDRPYLPDGINSLEIDGLHIGSRRIHLRFTRAQASGTTEVEPGQNNQADIQRRDE
jgi:glycogen debranching enzyme